MQFTLTTGWVKYFDSATDLADGRRGLSNLFVQASADDLTASAYPVEIWCPNISSGTSTSPLKTRVLAPGESTNMTGRDPGTGNGIVTQLWAKSVGGVGTMRLGFEGV